MTKPKSALKLDSMVEMNFEQSEVRITIVSQDGAYIPWNEIENAVRELREDWEADSEVGEVH